MKTRLLLFGLVLSLAGGAPLRAAAPPRPPAVTPQDLRPLSKLNEAQQIAVAQGKPIGFLLTWPIFFPGAKDFHQSGSLSASYFYQGFKDQAVLVNVDHATNEVDRLPKVAADAFHSPAEGGFAPCLCLTDAKCTRLIGMIPLWNNPVEREMFFQQYQAVIADQKRWGEAARRVTVTATAAIAPGPTAAMIAVPIPAAALPTPRPAATPPARASSAFAREMELTRQAEQQQATKVAPSP